jgi:acyl-CoA reductase-like NAD-dependent aldehyde dehydrogenase
LPDVDIDRVAPLVIKGAFINSGQMCVAAKRVYIHDSIYDRFRQAMVKSLHSLVVGNAEDRSTTLGPLQNGMQYDHVQGILEDSARHGYKSEVGKLSISPASGYFIPPTLIDNPSDTSRIVAEEQFGKPTCLFFFFIHPFNFYFFYFYFFRGV